MFLSVCYISQMSLDLSKVMVEGSASIRKSCL